MVYGPKAYPGNGLCPWPGRSGQPRTSVATRLNVSETGGIPGPGASPGPSVLQLAMPKRLVCFSLTSYWNCLDDPPYREVTVLLLARGGLSLKMAASIESGGEFM